MRIEKWKEGKKNFWINLARQLQTAPSNGETTLANTNAIRDVIIEKAREDAVAKGEDPNRAEEDIMRRTGAVATAFPLALAIAGAGTAVAANPALYGKAAFETAASMAGGAGVDAASEAITGKTFGENVAHYTGADKVYQNNALARFGFDMLNPGYALGGGVGRTVLGRMYPTVFNPNVDNVKNKWIANIAGSDGKIFNSKIVRNRNNYYRAVDKDAIIDANTSGLIRGVKARGNDNFPFFARSQEPYTYRKYVIEGTPDSAEWISTYPYAYSKNPEIVKMPKFAERDYSLGYETPIGSKDINGFQLTGGFDPEFLKGYEALPMTNGNVNGSNANNFSYWKRYPLFGWRHKNFNIKAIPSEQTPLKEPISKQYISPEIKQKVFLPQEDIAFKKLTETEINSPEWDLLETPAIAENYGVSAKRWPTLSTKWPKSVKEKQSVIKTPDSWDKFKALSKEEQDAAVRVWWGEKYHSYNALQHNKRDFANFKKRWESSGKNKSFQVPSEKQGGILKVQNGMKIKKYQQPAEVLPSKNTVRTIFDRIEESPANFVQRLLDPNREYIPDWKKPGNITTHKLSYAKQDDKYVIYPDVQEIEGELHDFTDPKYKHKKWDAMESAVANRDTIQVDSKDFANWFTKHYKEFYPGFTPEQMYETPKFPNNQRTRFGAPPGPHFTAIMGHKPHLIENGGEI